VILPFIIDQDFLFAHVLIADGKETSGEGLYAGEGDIDFSEQAHHLA
jgi:hypothetical protein